jgi:hypothetical protein
MEEDYCWKCYMEIAFCVCADLEETLTTSDYASELGVPETMLMEEVV